jgi:hypothetical protein
MHFAAHKAGERGGTLLLRWAISASYFANRGVELTDKHAHKHQKEAGRLGGAV